MDIRSSYFVMYVNAVFMVFARDISAFAVLEKQPWKGRRANKRAVFLKVRRTIFDIRPVSCVMRIGVVRFGVPHRCDPLRTSPWPI